MLMFEKIYIPQNVDVYLNSYQACLQCPKKPFSMQKLDFPSQFTTLDSSEVPEFQIRTAPINPVNIPSV